MKIQEGKAEKVGGLIIFVFSLVLIFFLIPTQVRHVQGFGVSSRLMPNIIAFALLILSVNLFFTGHKKIKKNINNKTFEINALELRLVLITLCMIAVYIIVVKHFGYITTTILALGITMYLYGHKNKKTIIFVSVLVPLVIYQFFTKLMQIRLP